MFRTIVSFFWNGFSLADASVANRWTRDGDGLRAVHPAKNGVRCNQIVVVGVVVVIDRNCFVSDLYLDAVGNVGLDVDREAVDTVYRLLQLIRTFFLLRMAKTFGPKGAQQQSKE